MKIDTKRISESKMFVPLNAAMPPSEDNYSSEEELKEIINEQVVTSPAAAGNDDEGSKAKAGVAKKKSPSKKEKKLTAKNNSNSTASSVKKDIAAEKRKWSEVISDDDLGDLDEEDDGLELEMTSRSYSRVYVRSSGGNSTTASSSCSNEDESCVCGRRLTTPVQFCTSPPMDVHRPRRKPWTPPPPKVFHVMSNHSASFDLTTQEDDDEIVDIENRASRPLRPSAAFMPGKYIQYIHKYIPNTFVFFLVTTGNGNASICNGVTSTTMPSSSEFFEATNNAASPVTSASTSQYCPRHHHHTQQQQQQRQTPSPNKRHRLTPRPHNIQRPCLDFEKMQQVTISLAGKSFTKA